MVELSYIAGFFDGEGCFSLIRRWANGATSAECKVRIINTSLEPLVEIQKFLGGKIRKRNEKRPRCKDNYCWYIGSVSECLRVTSILEPHLIAKKKQAQLMIEYCKNHVLYESLTIKEKEICEEMLSLNSKGADLKSLSYREKAETLTKEEMK